MNEDIMYFDKKDAEYLISKMLDVIIGMIEKEIYDTYPTNFSDSELDDLIDNMALKKLNIGCEMYDKILHGEFEVC